MREIKFRAWDKKCNQMINYLSTLNFDFNNTFVGLKSEYDLEIKDGQNSFIHDRLAFEVELEQYTGLKDKNGKEIYEGDIVYNEADKYNYQIIWNEREARFTLGEDSGPLSTYVLGTFWEVIGNIHENPELLNK